MNYCSSVGKCGWSEVVKVELQDAHQVGWWRSVTLIQCMKWLRFLPPRLSREFSKWVIVKAVQWSVKALPMKNDLSQGNRKFAHAPTAKSPSKRTSKWTCQLSSPFLWRPAHWQSRNTRCPRCFQCGGRSRCAQVERVWAAALDNRGQCWQMRAGR